jgi:TrkA domain protein
MATGRPRERWFKSRSRRTDGEVVVIIERVALPGIGVCHTATTARRQRLGVVGHLTGRRDLILYDPDDPDRTAHAVVLDPAEAGQVADLLAASVTVDHAAADCGPAGAITVARLRIPVGSPYAARSLRDVDAGPGARIVAVIRDDRVIAEPDQGLRLHHGDTLVAVGEQAAITDLAEQVRGGWYGPGSAGPRRRIRSTTGPRR